MGRMNKNLQVYKIREYLRKQGIDPQTIDVEHLVDSRLTYRENLRRIKKYVATRRDPTLEEALASALRYAAYVHSQRSEKSRRLDNKLRARNTIKPRPNSLTLAKIELWFKNPSRYDIEGIDAGAKKRKARKKRKKRIKVVKPKKPRGRVKKKRKSKKKNH